MNLRNWSTYLLNCLGIATVAVMVTAGKEGLAYCRTDRVFADAAYVVLTRDSRARAGEFLYDEDVLREAGVTDFEQYSYIPGIVFWYNVLTTCTYIGSELA